MPDSMLISPTGMHSISIPLALDHLNMTMFHVSILLSIGDADLERSDGRIVYFVARILKNHAGTDISLAPGLREK
jgi:hypothetical protein